MSETAKERAERLHIIIAANDGFFHADYFRGVLERGIAEAEQAAFTRGQQDMRTRAAQAIQQKSETMQPTTSYMEGVIDGYLRYVRVVEALPILPIQPEPSPSSPAPSEAGTGTPQEVKS